jgi:hypothetical protein
MPEAIFIKLGMYIMTPEPITSTIITASQIAEATVPLLLRVDSLLRKRVYRVVA